MPKTSDQNFTVFVDEHTQDEAAQADRHWRKNTRSLRDKKYTRILFVSIFVIFIILGILLAALETHSPTHDVVDYDQGLLKVTSLIPHLTFLVDKQSHSMEARTLKHIGIVYPELLTWIEGTVQPNWKVLLVPNEQAGVNVFAMALGYYLSSQAGGSLTVIIKDPNFKTITEKNLNLMKQLHPERFRLPPNITGKYDPN